MAKAKKSFFKRLLIILMIIVVSVVVISIPSYFLARYTFNSYFEHWGNKLVDLEKRNLLSKEYGAGWQDVITDKAMEDAANRITSRDTFVADDLDNNLKMVDGVALQDYPSLSIIARLNEVRNYSNTIEIVDRADRNIAKIKTDHKRATISEFPPTLIKTLLAAEDKNFRDNKMGFEFDSFLRAAIRSGMRSVFSLSKAAPRGTSTITQQVAKLFISRLDEAGRRHVSHSVDRKIRELRLAVAMRKIYTPDEILEVYLNHCVTSDFGMIGYKDIARGLFNKELDELSDAQCIYLARMVKWGRNIKPKIVTQCKIDMPRMGEALGWSEVKQKMILSEIDTLSFVKPKRLQSAYGSLVDLANEFWLLALRQSGRSEEEIQNMDLIDPNSLVRKKGNLRIKLTIDVPLQQELERLVNARGYGPDTTIITEVRIGSSGEITSHAKQPLDTIRSIKVLREPVDYSEPGSSFITSMNPGDTIVMNIRYHKEGGNKYRRSCFYYMRKPTLVNGQYYAYSMMDSKTGKILAYYSKDQLGSRLACLLKNRTPNGSSTAKPVFNALNFDLRVFKPYSKWTDAASIREDVPWSRTLDYQGNKMIGVIFDKSSIRGRGYQVHNHESVFEGCQYVFDLLSTSNNILGVETVYRLDHQLFDKGGEILPDAFPLVQFFYRIGAFSRIKDSLDMKYVTGVRVYKELARIIGVDIDSMVSYGKRIPISDSMYSVALGTLEMTLYEQMHMFNVIYNNDLIERPAEHPSLVIDSIELNSMPVFIDDTIMRYHPFEDINNLRPTYLGLHKRLTSNRGDGLTEFDIPYQPDLADPIYSDGQFHDQAYSITEPMSNLAKSGTTDDVIRPFNVDASSLKRTNYGIWNAVVRVDLSRLSGTAEPDIRDVTIACIGECNQKYTGVRDGKTLHKFLTMGLLHDAGVKGTNGFFAQYDAYLHRVTPSLENCGQSTEPSPTSPVPGVKIQQVREGSWLDSLGD